MSDTQRLLSEVDDLERKLRRLLRDIEGGAITSAIDISDQIRRILRNEVDNIDRIAKSLN